MEIVGKLKEIKEVKEISENFRVQRVIVDLSIFDRYTGELQENFAEIQFSNKVIETLSAFKVGDMVKVHFYIKGAYVKSKASDDIIFVQNVVGYKIEKK
jgi:hypothetical protein